MKILLFAASLRKDSCNKKLTKLTYDILKSYKEQSIEIDFPDFYEFEMPLYNGDIEENKGLPNGALQFIDRLQKSDGLIVASPEYNYSTPGTLKNLIDWVSRKRPMPWKSKPILLLSASPSEAGGSRGLLQTKIPLECCGAYVYPFTFSLPDAYNAFEKNGRLKDHKNEEKLEKLLWAFLKFTDTISKSV